MITQRQLMMIDGVNQDSLRFQNQVLGEPENGEVFGPQQFALVVIERWLRKKLELDEAARLVALREMIQDGSLRAIKFAKDGKASGEYWISLDEGRWLAWTGGQEVLNVQSLQWHDERPATTWSSVLCVPMACNKLLKAVQGRTKHAGPSQTSGDPQADPRG